MSKVNIDLAVKCKVCYDDIEVTNAYIFRDRMTVMVKPHNCGNQRFVDFLLSEAQTSGDNRITKWLEMKKLEYELKNNIV